MKKKRRSKHQLYSQGHRQVARALNRLGVSIKNEYIVDSLPYDIFIKDLNLIIEYYGNRWHYHKKIYTRDYWDKVKKRYAYEKWEKDEQKIEFAKEQGYNVEIIWEYDWKRLSNKTRFIEKLIRKYRGDGGYREIN